MGRLINTTSSPHTKSCDKNIGSTEMSTHVEEWSTGKAIVGYQLCFLTPDICLEGLIQPVYHAASAQLAVIFCWDGLLPQVVVVC